jgi:hypothetical protein
MLSVYLASIVNCLDGRRIAMKNSIPRFATAVLLCTALGQWPASAAPVTLTGPTAVAVAAVVAQYSPMLNPGERKVIAGLFDGNGRISYPKKKLSVTADSVMCRISNVAIVERSCELAFTKGKRSLKGRAANELYATLASAGVAAEGAAGSMIEGITKLNCTLDLGEITQNTGGGADCSWEGGQ